MKKIIHITVRFILHFFWMFSIKKNRIIFTVYKGAQFSCNPKYIFIELYRKHKDSFDFVWCLNDSEQLPEDFQDVKIVRYKSIKYIYYQITSKIVVLNHANPVYIPLRKKQLKINTWHGGGAYKRVSMSVKNCNNKIANYKAKYEIKDTDYFISSCKKFTEVMLKSQLLSKNTYLEIGMPRNDIFFEKNNELQIKIKNKLKINSKIKTVLYAPTYRGAQNSEKFNITLDVQKVIESLENKFEGKWLLLLRTHINTITSLNNEMYINDVTLYPDMQELLLVADVLITDYSSSMWDFALTGKPAFLFTPDLEFYKNQDSGFYMPIEEWQYQYAKSNADLEQAILNFNESLHKERVSNYLKKMNSFENGNATKLVCNIVLKYLNLFNK